MRKGNTANARECALSVLVACRRNGAWADAALKAQLGKCALSAQDAALCSRIVYGVMQNELLLNWYLSAYCTQKLDHLQPPLSDILRIGAYQILFLDKVPGPRRCQRVRGALPHERQKRRERTRQRRAAQGRAE